MRLGSRAVSAYGLGTLPLGVTYSGGGRPSRSEAIAVIHAAIASGADFFDTSDACVTSSRVPLLPLFK